MQGIYFSKLSCLRSHSQYMAELERENKSGPSAKDATSQITVHRLFASATVTTTTYEVGLSNRNLQSHNFRCQKSQVNVSVQLAPPESCEEKSIPCFSLQPLRLAGNPCHSLTCTHSTLISGFIFAWCSPYLCVCLSISPLYKDISHIGCKSIPIMQSLT